MSDFWQYICHRMADKSKNSSEKDVNPYLPNRLSPKTAFGARELHNLLRHSISLVPRLLSKNILKKALLWGPRNNARWYAKETKLSQNTPHMFYF